MPGGSIAEGLIDRQLGNNHPSNNANDKEHLPESTGKQNNHHSSSPAHESEPHSRSRHNVHEHGGELTASHHVHDAPHTIHHGNSEFSSPNVIKM